MRSMTDVHLCRIMPEVPSNMQQGLAYLELESNHPHNLYRSQSTASVVSSIHENYGASRNIVYDHQPANNVHQGYTANYRQADGYNYQNIPQQSIHQAPNNVNQGYTANYGQADGSNYQNIPQPNIHQPPQLSQRAHEHIPLPSPFPSLQNPGPNVPPSDDQKEEDLDHSREVVLKSNDAERQMTWAQDALHWSDIAIQSRIRAAVGAPNRPTTPNVERRIRDDALNVVKFLADQGHPKAEFLRANWYEFGKFGYPEDTKEAFAGYRRAAEKGYARAEYRMGTKYESNKDLPRTIKHYQNGVAMGDSASNYRMGMMALLGQYGQPQNYEVGVNQIKYAADTADANAPQGAYVYGMLLARELPNILLPDFVLPYDIDQAKHYVERAAFLGFPKAQLKMGSAYELCLLGCEFNPAFSLHYNRLAANQGEPEAEMAISKWFLCGYKCVFEKNEEIAFQYAKRAAEQEFSTAEFALGYFYEVGLHVHMDLGRAREWYQKAADHGNADALPRLEAIRMHRTLSKTDHEEVAIQRIKSKYGSRRGQRPDHLLQKQYAPPVPPLSVMVEEESFTPVNNYPSRSSSTATTQPPFRVVTPVPDANNRPVQSSVQPPFRVVTPVPSEGRHSRASSDPRINSHSGSGSGGSMLMSPTGQNGGQLPLRPKSTAPYPEDDMARGNRQAHPLSELLPLAGPPADRPNSAFGIKPLHPNHSLGQRQEPPRVRPASSMSNLPSHQPQQGRPASAFSNLPSQQPQQGRGQPVGRGQPMVPNVARRDGTPTTKDWESQYRLPYKQDMLSPTNDGRNKLQKQPPHSSKPQPSFPSQRESRPPQPTPIQTNDYSSNRPAVDDRYSGSYTAGPRNDRMEPMLQSQHHGGQRPSTSQGNSQNSAGSLPQRNSSTLPTSANPAVTISPAPSSQSSAGSFPQKNSSTLPTSASPAVTISPAPSSQSAGSKPPKKGPQTFEEMGVPAAPKQSECVSLTSSVSGNYLTYSRIYANVNIQVLM